MPERGYFSLRYAIPGYTFILIFVVTNYIPLLEILEATGLESTFGAFLAFLSLLTGSALGFLVSQFWWWRFLKNGGFHGKEPSKPFKALNKKYGLTKNQLGKGREKITLVYDYIAYSEKNRELLRLAERRWDMYHLLSSEWYTLKIGLILGLCFRFFCQYFLFKSLSFTSLSFCDSLRFLFTNSEFLVLFFTSIIVVVWLFLLKKLGEHTKTQILIISEVIVKKSEITRSELGEFFSVDYFDLGIEEKMAAKLENAGIFSVSDFMDEKPNELSEKTGISEQDISIWLAKAKEWVIASKKSKSKNGSDES